MEMERNLLLDYLTRVLLKFQQAYGPNQKALMLPGLEPNRNGGEAYVKMVPLVP